MNLSKLYARTKKAVEEYKMIESGDKIAIGLSGGKDSLALLYALHGLSKFKDANFTLIGIMVDMGFNNFNPAPVAQLCNKLNIPFVHIETQLGDVVFNQRKETNPCSICSKMRKGILNKELLKLGCNKLAYGHHRDDFINTFMLSLFYEGRFHTMEPTFHMSKTDLTLIRPLLYVPEKDIEIFSKEMNLPIIKNPCPADHKSERKNMEQLLDKLKIQFPDCKEKMFSALKAKNYFLD